MQRKEKRGGKLMWEGVGVGRRLDGEPDGGIGIGIEIEL